MKNIAISLLCALSLSLPVCGQAVLRPEGVANIAMQFDCQPRTATSLAMAGIDAFDNLDFYVRDSQRVDLNLSYMMWERTASVATSPVDASVKYRINSLFGVSASMHVDRMKSTIPTDETATFVRNGEYRPSNLALGAGFDFFAAKNVDIFLRARYLRSNFYLGQDYQAVAFDAVASAYFGPVGVSAGVADIGPKVSGKYALPSSALAAVCFDHKGIKAEVQANYYMFGGFRLAAAASYTYAGIVSARVGYNKGKNTPLEDFASVGLGVRVYGIQLNLAYLFSNNPLNGTAGISLNYKF